MKLAKNEMDWDSSSSIDRVGVEGRKWEGNKVQAAVSRRRDCRLASAGRSTPKYIKRGYDCNCTVTCVEPDS
jgi:hypothetical protein